MNLHKMEKIRVWGGQSVVECAILGTLAGICRKRERTLESEHVQVLTRFGPVGTGRPPQRAGRLPPAERSSHFMTEFRPSYAKGMV